MTTNKDNFCVIMGGGIGSRFWPFSRKRSLNSFWTSLAQAGHYCNKPSTASIKLFPQRTYLSLQTIYTQIL